MDLPQVYICSPSWTLLPPHTLPLGRPSAPAPSIQYCASNLDWRLVIKRLFSSSSLSAIKVVSSAYMRLLIFLPAILIPACASSSAAFRMVYSAYKLNKQDDNIQPWHTPFPIWNQSVFPCPFLTVVSWRAYRFLRRQGRWSGIPISKNFPQLVVIHTVKGFGVVSKAEICFSGTLLHFQWSNRCWQFDLWFLCLL